MPTIGLFNALGATDRASLARIGPLAERLGYDSIWLGEHIVVPDPQAPPSPIAPTDAILDPLVGLGFLAAITERVRLATGVIILPQRNPLVLAKQLASLDVLSGGRVTVGLGVGYLEPEMSAVGVPMERRGARADEYLAAMRALWDDERPSFAGEFASFAGVNAHPRPLQRPLPIVIGGHTSAAHRRTARSGDGWYGFLLDRDACAEQLEGLRGALSAAGRDPATVAISVTPRGPLNPERVEQFAALGVDRLVVAPAPALSPDELDDYLRAHAPERLGATPAG